MHHAHGTFTVDVHPLTPAPAEGLGRFSIDKQIHGDLEATTKGEMFTGGDPKQGLAGYVAIEMVTGTLARQARQLRAAALRHNGCERAQNAGDRGAGIGNGRAERHRGHVHHQD